MRYFIGGFSMVLIACVAPVIVALIAIIVILLLVRS